MPAITTRLADCGIHDRMDMDALYTCMACLKENDERATKLANWIIDNCHLVSKSLHFDAMELIRYFERR